MKKPRAAPSSVSRRGSAGFAEEVQVFNYPGRGFQGSRHALNHICAQAQKPQGHAHGVAMRIGGTPGQRRPPAFKAGRALSTWFRVPAHCGSKALKSPQAHCILFARNAKPKETTPICRAGKCCLSTFRAVSSAHVVWVKGVEILADVSQDASARTARKSQDAKAALRNEETTASVKPKETAPTCAGQGIAIFIDQTSLRPSRAASSVRVVRFQGVKFLVDVSQDVSTRTARKSQYAGGVAQRRDNGLA